MLNGDSEFEILKIKRTCDMNSALGSVVPLAMFEKKKGRNCLRISVYHLADPREPADDEDEPVIKLNASGSKDDS